MKTKNVSVAAPSSIHARERPPVPSQDSEFSMDLVDESELAVPLSDATSAPSTYTQSKSGSQPVPTALPTIVPFYAGMALQPRAHTGPLVVQQGPSSKKPSGRVVNTHDHVANRMQVSVLVGLFVQ